LPEIHNRVLGISLSVTYLFSSQIGASRIGKIVDIREINEKRYEVAASQIMTVLLVGIFTNLGIFAITAFADLSSGAQADWKVIVSVLEFLFLFGVIGVTSDISAYIKDIPSNEDSQWNKQARSAPTWISAALFGAAIIVLWVFQLQAIGA